MKLEQKAVIARAQREGLAPSEIAAELLTHDLVNSALAQMRGHSVAFKNMSEQQQDATIHAMQTDFKAAVDNAVRIISGAGTKTVRMKLKKVAIGTSYQIQGVADRAEENLHALCDKAQDQSDVLIVLYEHDYHQGLDAIQGEKDQKALPLEGGKDPKPKATRGAGPKKAGDIAAKVIELPPALVEQAEAFVRNIQTATHAGIQNQFKINFDKAEALLQALQERGVVTEKDEQGNRTLVRAKADAPATAGNKATEAMEQQTIKGDKGDLPDAELYEHAKAKVIADQEVSAGGLAVFFDLTDERAADLMDELEMHGVISEASDLGTREVLMANQVH